jgi:hypothetical protein
MSAVFAIRAVKFFYAIKCKPLLSGRPLNNVAKPSSGKEGANLH